MFLLFVVLRGWASEPDIANVCRITAFPWYDFDDHWTAFARLGTSLNPDKNSRVSNLISPGMYYAANNWLQLWGGVNNRYSRNEDQPDELELRSFIGTKLSLPNNLHLHLYDFTRYEFRAIENLSTHQWDVKHRIRSRFGAEVSLAGADKAWRPKTWYALANVEPFYAFDEHAVDPLRVSGGIAYIVNQRLRLEFLYYAQFTRVSGGTLALTENIFRLNVKINLSHLEHTRGPGPSL